MIPRRLTHEIKNRLKRYPAVAILGPRQAGKTTLAKSFEGHYVDLEQEKDRLRLDLHWNDYMFGPSLVILDEAQAWPEIFPRLRGAIDQNRKRNGRFLLLGSVSPALMTKVSESLAGRLSLVELTPLLLTELPDKSLDDVWLYGGFADGGILLSENFPQWQRDYLALLTQRDLPNWGLPAKPQVTDKLLKMLAAVHGQLWNATQIAQSLGISHPTVNEYMNFLVDAFLIRRLPPYQANLKKRLVKSPRFYWRDSGLLHALLTTPDYDELLAKPWVGASWEGFIIEQILGTLQDQQVGSYFLRTSDGYEINLVLGLGNKIWAIEVKLTSQPDVQDFNRLNKAADLINAEKRFLISRVSESVITENQISCSLPEFLKFFDD